MAGTRLIPAPLFISAALILLLGLSSTAQGRPLPMASTGIGKRHLGHAAAAARELRIHNPGSRPDAVAQINLADPNAYVDDFRPTSPGHSPSVGHSVGPHNLRP